MHCLFSGIRNHGDRAYVCMCTLRRQVLAGEEVDEATIPAPKPSVSKARPKAPPKPRNASKTKNTQTPGTALITPVDDNSQVLLSEVR